jgi:DNA-binding transcriptional ArsR family regulator
VTAPPDQPGEQLLKAIAHPLRQRILSAIDEHGPISPNGVAQMLSEPLGRVSHHVRVLAGLEAIELVDTQPRRGAVEHFYRARIKPWFDDDAWSKLPLSARRALFAHPLQRLLRDVTTAAAGSGFDHPRAHVSYTTFDVDDEGMDALADLLAETLDRAQAIQTEANKRLAGAEAARHTELGILHFERPPE